MTTPNKSKDTNVIAAAQAVNFAAYAKLANAGQLRESVLENAHNNGSISVVQYAELLPKATKGTIGTAQKAKSPAALMLAQFKAGPGQLTRKGEPKAEGSLAREITVTWVANGKACSSRARIMGTAESVVTALLDSGFTPTVAFTQTS